MTEFTFECPNCQQHLSASEDMKGQTVACPTCGEQIQIPTALESPSLTEAHSSAAPFALDKPFATAFRQFRRNFWLCTFAAMVYQVILYGTMLVPVVNIVGLFVWLIPLAAGFAFFSLEIARGSKPAFRGLFSGFGRSNPYIAPAFAALGLGLVSVYLVPILFILEWIGRTPSPSRNTAASSDGRISRSGPLLALIATLLGFSIPFFLVFVVILFLYCRMVEDKNASPAFPLSKSIRMVLVAPFRLSVVFVVSVLLSFCLFAIELLVFSLPVMVVTIPFIVSGDEGSVIHQVITTVGVLVAMLFASGAYALIRLSVLHSYDTAERTARAMFAHCWDQKLSITEVREYIREQYFGWKPSNKTPGRVR